MSLPRSVADNISAISRRTARKRHSVWRDNKFLIVTGIAVAFAATLLLVIFPGWFSGQPRESEPKPGERVQQQSYQAKISKPSLAELGQDDLLPVPADVVSSVSNEAIGAPASVGGLPGKSQGAALETRGSEIPNAGNAAQTETIPNISGTWQEVPGVLVEISQRGGDFTATTTYQRPTAGRVRWVAQGKIDAEGKMTMSQAMRRLSAFQSAQA